MDGHPGAGRRWTEPRLQADSPSHPAIQRALTLVRSSVTVLLVKYRNDIQGLRAIAVLLVIFAHVGVAGFAGGWIGVDVFFVISGFLITGLLIREYDSTNHVSLLQFYIRRAKRILPASLITIVVVLIASNLLLNSIRTANINTDAIWAVGFVSNIHFIRINTDYFTSGLAVSPLQHFWSLAVEEQFYLIWPALFLLISRQHGMRIRNWSISRSQRVLLIAVIASALSLMWSISYTNSNPTSAYFSTLTRVWELGFGVLLACTIPQIQRLTERWTDDKRSVAFAAASWAGLTAIILGACVIIKPGDPFPGYLALIPVLGAIGLIFGGLAEKQPIPNRILSMQPLPFIGLISFSLYLWHWPIHVFADALYPDSANTAFGIVAQLVVILAISLVSYYLIENTTRHLAIGTRETTRKKFAEISKVPTAAITVMCVSAAFLFIVSNAAGGGRTDDAETSALSDIVTETSSFTISTSTTIPGTDTGPTSTISGRTELPLAAAWREKIIEGSKLKSPSAETLNIIATLPASKLIPNSFRSIGEGSVANVDSQSAENVIEVWGDSHASMLSTMVTAAFPDWRVIIRSLSN
jgi:peptidoglycan/LPS O-acetylase OafA/YrhL